MDEHDELAYAANIEEVRSGGVGQRKVDQSKDDGSKIIEAKGAGT